MLITVRVLPRSGRNTLEWENGNLKARLTAPPVDGAANEALVALLAERLARPRRTIHIVRGATSRLKTVEIEGIDQEELVQKIPL
ncbi:DUF167 domain-containing protein [Tengunoibacter tsumagoiensis]|uniref:UPF0235 protein KTT_39800 n=1 Tax=Tengunoibacter tsumagoiensis TaxID=2014871 RepID=A0A402A542_9CHLR|nr:DUF167 domain-containing protein [Tengunoibacter tsumagoiensis]GCE14121.1 hypothetical protein KTT_39800 [Tengunoibacter tsumagoiensis]